LERFVVAQPRLKQMKAKSGITLLPKKMKGPRKAVRGYTLSGMSAVWPNDGLLETHAPLLTFVLAGQADLHCGPPPRPLPQITLQVKGNNIYATGVELRTTT
jgi:hypothetical protein